MQAGQHLSAFQQKQNRCGEQRKVKYESLLHRVKQLEIRLNQEGIVIETLKFHNEELNKQLIHQNSLIQQLKMGEQKNQLLISDLRSQYESRKRSSEQIIKQLRSQQSIMQQKNARVCQIVNILEEELRVEKERADACSVAEEGLKKRICQLVEQNQNIRKIMAKAEVEAEKYKLKAIEGEKFWSGKLERQKQKHEEIVQKAKKQEETKLKQQIINAKAQTHLVQKVLRIKQKQVLSLQQRIHELITKQG